MKRWNISWDVMLIVAIVAVAGVCSQSQQVAFADGNAEDKGRVVQISPDAEAADISTKTKDPARGDLSADPETDEWIQSLVVDSQRNRTTDRSLDRYPGNGREVPGTDEYVGGPLSDRDLLPAGRLPDLRAVHLVSDPDVVDLLVH